MGMYAVALILAGIAVVFKKSVYIVREWERGVVLRFGRYNATRTPGIKFVIPFVDEFIRVDQRMITMDVPSQDVITRDNISIKVNAVIYFKVFEPSAMVTQVDNYLLATSQFASTSLRSICGEFELDGLLSQRDEVNKRIQAVVDQRTETWGVKVTNVEIKDIDLPEEMKRSMARQAEAERERRAKIIQAEGEFQAAEKLTAAAGIMSSQSAAMQLRYLDTLRAIATEHNSTIVFPLPMELIEPFIKRAAKSGA